MDSRIAKFAAPVAAEIAACAEMAKADGHDKIAEGWATGSHTVTPLDGYRVRCADNDCRSLLADMVCADVDEARATARVLFAETRAHADVLDCAADKQVFHTERG